MKKLKYILFIILPLATHAQSVLDEYLMDNFIVSVATVKQGTPIRSAFNYNYLLQEMHFEEEGEIFKLQDINNIDTLFLDDHKMVPYAGRFLDVIHTTPQYKILLDYKLKKINKGKKGAMGMATQGTVETIDFSKSGRNYNQITMKDNAVYNYKNESSYYIEINGKKEKIKDAKSFTKHFPEKKEKIESYIKAHKVDFKDMDQIIALLEFSLK